VSNGECGVEIWLGDPAANLCSVSIFWEEKVAQRAGIPMAFATIRELFTRSDLLRSKNDGRTDMPTSENGQDLELFRKEIK